LVSIRRADGIATELPYVSRSTIAAASYPSRIAFPAADTTTVATHELLVAAASLPERDAYKIVETLFTSSSKVVAHFPLLTQLSRIEPDRNFYYPLHDGASAFYRRSGVPALVSPERLAGAFSYSASMVTGALFWVRKRRMKRVTDVVASLRGTLREGTTLGEIDRIRASLEDVRCHSFERFVAGSITYQGWRTIREATAFGLAEVARKARQNSESYVGQRPPRAMAT